MPTIISLLRAVNVGGTGKVPKATLEAIYRILGFEDVRTYIQSGNVVFRTSARGVTPLAGRIETAIEGATGFRPQVILRTADEWRQVIANNPFAGREDIDPAKLLVMFLAAEPAARDWREKLESKRQGEEMHLVGRELYVYFPAGAGQSKLSGAIERAVKTAATGRNWNTVLKLMELASG